MIDHVSIAVRDLRTSGDFYERLLAPLGYIRLVERPATVGFGRKYPELWLNARPEMPALPSDTGAHLCLRAADDEAVRAFHEAALAGGGASAGEPGIRRAERTAYYGAFILDPDGNKLEAAAFPRKNPPDLS